VRIAATIHAAAVALEAADVLADLKREESASL
jgi:hypothetical protein